MACLTCGDDGGLCLDCHGGSAVCRECGGEVEPGETICDPCLEQREG